MRKMLSPILELQEFIRILGLHRNLIRALVRKELTDRYVGQVLGFFWLFAHPALTVAIYLLLFGVVLGSRVAVGTSGNDYTIYLLAGLLPWLGFVDGLGRWPTAITGKASLVKQVIFPVEILPIVSVLVPLFTQGIMMLLFITFVCFQLQALPMNLWLLPCALFLQIVQMIGTAYLLSAIGVYFRDLKDFVQVFCSLGVYLAPIVYFEELLPQKIRPLIELNPFTHLIRCFRDSFGSSSIHIHSWLVSAALAFALLAFGFGFFRKTRSYFGSAL